MHIKPAREMPGLFRRYAVAHFIMESPEGYRCFAMPPVVLHEILYQRKCGSRPLGSSKQFSFKTDYSPSSWIILTCFINDRQRCLIIISIVRSMSQVERCRPGTWKVFTLFRCGLASGNEHRFSF